MAKGEPCLGTAAEHPPEVLDNKPFECVAIRNTNYIIRVTLSASVCYSVRFAVCVPARRCVVQPTPRVSSSPPSGSLGIRTPKPQPHAHIAD